MRFTGVSYGVLVFLTLAGFPALGAERPLPWSPRQPARPALTVNRQPDLCRALQDRASRWFASSYTSAWDLTDSLQGLEQIPMEGIENTVVQKVDIDLDSDGSKEQVLIRYTMFRAEDKYQGFVAAPGIDLKPFLEARSWPSRTEPIRGVVEFPQITELPAGEWDAQIQVLYGWRGRVLFKAARRDPARVGLALYQLSADGSTPLLCRVETDGVDAALEAWQDSPEIRALVKSLEWMGNGGGYCGTLNSSGYHYASTRYAMALAAVRPWTDPRSPANYGYRYFDYSPRLWQFLSDWSTADPWNRREFLTLLQSLEPARRAYASYVQRKFGLDTKDARVKGDVALENFVASWFQVPASYDPADSLGLPAPRISTDPNPANAFGKTRLMVAAHLNRPDLVRQFLEQGADPNAFTSARFGCEYIVQRSLRTPLMYAAENASPLVMKLLIDAGANSDVIDHDSNDLGFYLRQNPRLTDAQKVLPVRELIKGAERLADVPGFDCSRGRSLVDRTICDSEVLRLLDSEMTQAYRRVAARGGTMLRNDQRRWTRSRERECVKLEGDEFVQCLIDETAARERFLHRLAE